MHEYFLSRARRRRSPANRFGWDYAELASVFRGAPWHGRIIDVHSHINGRRAAEVYARAREDYGIRRTYSMSRLPEAEGARAVLGDSLRFIAVPDYGAKDRLHAHTQGFLDSLRDWHGLGARMVKWWCGPRGRDSGREVGDPLLLTLLNPWRRRQMDLAASLGMMFMAHIADPDTWFATRYQDASFYGTKASHYEPLEMLLEEYRVPWIVAHFGGWPEDLGFLDGLLSRHANLHLDASATKWMVRELSRHPREALVAFVGKWRERILFGSDIVTADEHVSAAMSDPMKDDAYDLYASRYWALRTLWETDYSALSPIADPDLKMVDPSRHDEMSAPKLNGVSLPRELLEAVYFGNAERVVERWYAERLS
ncbi:MAG: amidohydrolase family protein [Phycisphaerales bacterium]|nr:amidohydrolase family protein [Phycisphaerales bacterium]